MSRALIVVDYQVDFVSGSLGFAEAKELDEVIVQKIADARAHGDQVLFTLDTHTNRYLHTQEGRLLPVVHCVRESEGWQLYGKTAGARLPEDSVFEKSSFGSAALFHYLEEHSFSEIELCGLVSNICVLSNAILAKTALPEAKIVVDAAATGAADPAMNQKALDVLAGVQIEIIPRAERNRI